MIKKLVLFSNGLAVEFAKIYWPNLNGTILTSTIVVVVAVVIGMLFTGLDQLISIVLLIIFRANV